MSKSKIFFCFCVSFIVGIFAGSKIKIPQLLLWGFLILAIILVSLFWEKKKIVFAGFLLLFLIFGIWRVQDKAIKLKSNELINYNSVKEITSNKDSVSNLFYDNILSLKEKMQGIINQYIPFPESSVLEATILGNSSQMSYELKNKFNISGLRHVVAVSGMHISILSAILISFLIGLGFWRGQAFYLALIIIFLFIAIVGFQSSAVRAGIMGMIFLLGQKIGRQYSISRTIVIAAGFMLFQNPLLLTGDAGFQLSFLATLGIIYLNPIIARFLSFIKSDFLSIKSAVVMTISAQIFTLPILIYNFGRISFIAPLSNLFVLPAVPLMMIFGFIFVISGIIFPVISPVLSIPSYFLFSYFLKITELFSKSWMQGNIKNIHWFWMLLFYVVLSFFIWQLRRKEKLRFLDY